MYYLPSGMFVISSWITFLMAPRFPGRPAVLVTLFLVIVSIFTNVIDNTPSDDSGITAIWIWVLSSMFLIFIAFLEYGIVLAKEKFNCKDNNTNCNVNNENVRVFDVREKIIKNDEDRQKSSMNLDMCMLIISPVLFLIFNVYYWTTFGR